MDIEYDSGLDEFEYCIEHTGCWMYLCFYNVAGWPVSVHYSMQKPDDRLDIDREAELRQEICNYLPQIMQHEGWAGRMFGDHVGRRYWRAVPAVAGRRDNLN